MTCVFAIKISIYIVCFEIRKKSDNRGTRPVQCTLIALLEFWVCSHDPISIQFTIGDDKHQRNVGHKRTDFNLSNLCHYTIDNINTFYFETNASLGRFSFHLHFNLVSSNIALGPNSVELKWQLKWLNIISSIVISLILKIDRTRRCLSFWVTRHIKIFWVYCKMIPELIVC